MEKSETHRENQDGRCNVSAPYALASCPTALFIDCFATQQAPFRNRTAGTVWASILMSSQNDQLSIYCWSSSIHCLKEISLRPLICQRQVIPGLMERRRRYSHS